MPNVTQRQERAYELIHPLELDAMPGVGELEQAATLFQVELAEVERAAKHVAPWTTSGGQTIWSTRQLARRIVKDRARRPLTREQALDVREQARTIGVKKAAKKVGRTDRTIYATWARFGIPTLTDRKNRGGARGAVLTTREQAETMAAYLAAHGPDATVERYGTTRSTIYRTLQRFEIAPPNGKGKRAAA